MKKYAIFLIPVFALGLYAHKVKSQDMKVPADIGVSIRTLQLDEANLSLQTAQLQAQFTAAQTKYRQDEADLAGLDKQALETLKLDPAGFTVDRNTLVVVVKPAQQPKAEIK